MSTYSESLHPRGQARNAGQFRAKANDAPEAALDAPLRDRLDALRDGYGTQLIAAESADERALLADTAEQLAFAEAFERATGLSGADRATFRAGLTNGMTTIQCLESGLHIAAVDAVQAAAFSRVGNGIAELQVTRSHGGYTIHRIDVSDSGEPAVLTDEVDGEPRRWSEINPR